MLSREPGPLGALAADDAPPLVLVVDDDPLVGEAVELWLQEADFEAERVLDGEACLAALGRTLPDAICLDLTLPGVSGLDVLDKVKAREPGLPVIILTADRNVATVVEAMRRGAYDYVAKPLDGPKLVTTVRNAVERHRLSLRVRQLEREASGEGYPGIRGRSAAMRELFRQMDRVAPTDITVLLRGESGTGKELVARALHERSPRRKEPFVALNCAAIAESLQESELFGHERGAFTSAEKRRIGKFEEADRGTLFLDEVAELTPALQAKLLRVLQERSFTRVGGSGELRTDFRLIAATHRDLAEAVRRGAFREDLFFRIAVFELDLPPLRARREDIPVLAEAILEELGKKDGGRRLRLSAPALSAILAYSWPGNVRELQNALQRAFVVVAGDEIRPEDLPSRIREGAPAGDAADSGESAFGSGAPAAPPGPLPPAAAASAGEAIVDLEEVERRAIEEALRRTNGNISAVVRQLKIGRTTLYRKMKKFGLRLAPEGPGA